MLDLLTRTIRRSLRHDLGGRAAQVAFYSLLALFPGLLSLTGLLATLGVIDDIDRLFRLLRGSMPSDTAILLREELRQLPSRTGGAVIATIVFSIYYGSQALDALIGGAYVARKDDLHVPKRLSWLAVGGSGVVLVILFAMVSVLTVLGPAVGLLDQVSIVPHAIVVAINALRWPVIAGLFQLAVATLYWLGDRSRGYRVFSLGSLAATLAWLGLSLGYESLARSLSELGATYGSLAASIGLLLYLHTLSMCVLFGAELDGVRAEG